MHWIEMTESESSNIKSNEHAKLSVMLSLLKAFKLVEFLALANNLLTVIAVLNTHILPIKVLALLILIISLGVFYFALRIRIDVTLLEHWDSLDMSALDNALSNLSPKHQAGRPLEKRLQGSYRLFMQGLLLLLMQFCLFVAIICLV